MNNEIDLSTKFVLSTLNYVHRWSGQTLLLKVGGAALQHPDVMQRLAEDIRSMLAVGVQVVVVHGGGPAINRELEARGIKWDFLEGQRITTPQMMEVVEMVLCGLVNRQMVRALSAAGIRALGLSGADASILKCQKASPQLGQVGRIETVDTTILETLLKTGVVPVIAPIGLGESGEALNINADWAASHLAQALNIKKAIFLTDQDGILNEDGKVLSTLDVTEVENLINQKVVKGGMLAKAQTILGALRGGVKEVHVINGQRPHSLIEELFTDKGVGTLCRMRSRLEEVNQ